MCKLLDYIFLSLSHFLLIFVFNFSLPSPHSHPTPTPLFYLAKPLLSYLLLCFFCAWYRVFTLFFSQPCLHEGFESSFTARSHESCANCTTASVGRDTHLWNPMLCTSASRPSKPLDAASRCDPPLHCVMCHDGFPTMHSLVRCQGKRTNNRLPAQANMLPSWQGAEWVFFHRIIFTHGKAALCFFFIHVGSPAHSLALAHFKL